MRIIFTLISCLILLTSGFGQHASNRTSFNEGWTFNLGELQADPSQINFNDENWRELPLPHDWSIELPFDSTSPTGTGGGALRGGLGWYRKTFTLPENQKNKLTFIDFDGVYRNSEVFINGHSLGIRPNGYISFRYDLTPFLNFGKEKNVIAVKVDNSQQPNSRWYSGSGIYRNVWLTKTSKLHITNWGTVITTPSVSEKSADVQLFVTVQNEEKSASEFELKTTFFHNNKVVASAIEKLTLSTGSTGTFDQSAKIKNPELWSVDNPVLYRAVTRIMVKGKVVENYTTPFGIRTFNFDTDNGFFLNGKSLKIRGVCNHHDLGCLGTAINIRALQRQLEILKGMGVNAIRTSHNPPAPELLELADQMGFLIMDEAFDMWKKAKNTFDYSNDWDQWHGRDLSDQILRDRNHPSVFCWSIGNEIYEQYHSEEYESARVIMADLVSTVKKLDATRPLVTANNFPDPSNNLLRTQLADLTGYNYRHDEWDSVFVRWGRKPFIVTESVSALQTRGAYDMPSDSIRRWPKAWDQPLENANDDFTCSAYENCSTPWGSTHEETLRFFETRNYISGMFIWTGFDYLGEPTPYPWPARSSYFGIVDLAGFPKDVYYLYQSIWTEKPVLHLFPHWNWPTGKTIDVWAYFNNADEVELFLNGKSLGMKRKNTGDFHVMWRVTYVPGVIKAVSRKNGKTVLISERKTAGEPAKLILEADRTQISADGTDLSFVTVKIVDKNGNLVPDADNLVNFKVTGEGSVIAVDNGSQTSLESFKVPYRKAFNGLCLAVIQSNKKAGKITLEAASEHLTSAEFVIKSVK